MDLLIQFATIIIIYLRYNFPSFEFLLLKQVTNGEYPISDMFFITGLKYFLNFG